MKVLSRLTSSLEKIFIDEKIESYAKIEKISALRGERIAIQLMYKLIMDKEEGVYRKLLRPEIDGSLAEYAHVRRIEHLPITKPIGDEPDDNYLRTTAGVFPDVLLPLNYGKRVFADHNLLSSIWIDIEIPHNAPEGENLITVKLISDEGDAVVSESVTVEVIGASLPEPELYYTRWLHTDCLASYYRTPVWSKRHWEIIESFAREAVRCGINTLLTPLITPSLDGPRMITQLVKIKKSGEKYSFDFSRVGRWVDMCDRVGIKYFEISHLFTQGGAEGTPRIVATVDGEERMIFSYETDARDPEYRRFLRALMTAFIRYMKRRGDDARCIFHISDEPPKKFLENYRYAKSCVSDILAGYKFIDALSDFEFYTEGLVECPVPLTRAIEPFATAGVEHLWTYYCCGPTNENFSNSFIAMPSYRTRSIGIQLYKYNIEGFLHWGFNFYNNRCSDAPLNPYLELSGENWVPAGDPFIVYPAPDGTAYASIREEVMYHALEDIRAMKLCERYYSHREVVAAIEEELGYTLDFRGSVRSSAVMARVRERINEMIKTAIKR